MKKLILAVAAVAVFSLTPAAHASELNPGSFPLPVPHYLAALIRDASYYIGGDPLYPIGKFEHRRHVTPDDRRALIDIIADAPRNMRSAVANLSEAQLDTPYREGGWTARQVVHHLPDSHLNAYVRMKLALTEEKPTIKPYNEAAWAELADSKSMPIEVSQTLLDSVHTRWDRLWRSLKPEHFLRILVHPGHGERTVDWLLFLYEWHGKHHTAHITELRKKKSW